MHESQIFGKVIWDKFVTLKSIKTILIPQKKDKIQATYKFFLEIQ